MKIKIIPFIVGALETFLRGLEKELVELEISRRIETIQTTTLLRLARILRSVLGTRGELMSV